MKKKIFLAISYTKRKKVENAITNFFENSGFEVITGRKIRSGKNQGDEIKRIIKTCEFGLVVFNELRHNISYEWGLLDALISEKGHIFLFKDVNTHIDLYNELSDKEGTNFTAFYGEDSEEEIVKSLEKNVGLMELIEEYIGNYISYDHSKNVAEAAKAIRSTNLHIKLLVEGGIKYKRADLENLKLRLNKLNLTIEGHYYKALTYYYMGELKVAEFEIRKVIKLDYGNSIAHETLGVILSKLGRNKEAVDEIEIAFNTNPSYNTYINLGIVLMKVFRYSEAKSIIEKGILLEKDNALGYSVLGGVLTNLGELNDAEKALNKALNLEPTFPMVNNIFILLLMAQERYEEAERKLKEKLTLEPNNTKDLQLLGRLYINLNRYEEAKKTIDFAIKLEPNNSNIISEYGILLHKLNDSNAEKYFKKAIEIDPKNHLILNDYCTFLLNNNRYEDAKTVLETVLVLNPDDFFIIDTLRHVLIQLKQYNVAKKEYEKYLVNSENIYYLINMSELYLISDDYPKADIITQKGLKISEKINDKIIFKFLSYVSRLLIGKNPDEKELITYLKRNKGYKLTFEFETLKSVLNESRYYIKIEKMINILKRCSKKD